MPNEPLAAVRFSGVQLNTSPVFASTLITALAGLVMPPCTVLSHWQAATIVEPTISMSRTCGGVLCARSDRSVCSWGGSKPGVGDPSGSKLSRFDVPT